MRSIGDFSSAERRRATDRLRLVDHSNALKVVHKSHFWSVAFLLRLIDRVDETITDDPKKALGYAEGLPGLARRIPVQAPPERAEGIFYEDRAEAVGFQAFAHSVLSSALCAAGGIADARWEQKKALDLARSSPKFARAEVLRRSALVESNVGDYRTSMAMTDEAIELFHDLQDVERLALSHICRGTILNLRDGPGAGLIEYATAIHTAAQVRSKRAEKAIVIAATNLGMCAARSNSTDLEQAYKYTRAAIETMNRRRHPLGIPKLTVRWTEAVIAYRFGVGRYSVRWLRRVRDGLLQAGALRQGVCCIVDLLTIVEDYCPEDLDEIALESLNAVRGALVDSAPDDDETAQALEAWADQPSDIESLRRCTGRKSCISGRRP